MSRAAAAAEKAALWVAEHRTGKCGEQRCRRIVREELDLGLPKSPFERERVYEERRAEWQPLRTALDFHRWSFQQEACQECGEVTLCLTGGEKAACIQTCLATAIPWWPTGHQLPWVYDLVDHLKQCISHSSSLTPSHLDALANLRISSKTLREQMWPSPSTSSTAKKRTPAPSSRSTRSSVSGSSRPKLRAFSIPKKSN